MAYVSNYKRDLLQAQNDFAALTAQKENLEIRIARVKRKIALLSELSDEDAVATIPVIELGGLTEACSTVLRASRREWLTAGEIQAALKEMGFDLSKYKAPASAITTTVNRLAEAGKVLRDLRPAPGVAEYKWIGLSYGAQSNIANLHNDDELAEVEKIRKSQVRT